MTDTNSRSVSDSIYKWTEGIVKRSGGYDRPNRFLIEISPPKDFIVPSSVLERIEANCISVPLPGSMVDSESNEQGGEALEWRAMRLSVGDPILRFRLSKDHAEKTFFENWRRMCFGVSFNRLNYYENYIGSIKVHKLDLQNRISHTYTMIEVYPSQIQDTDLSYTEGDAVSEIVVIFKMFDWIKE